MNGANVATVATETKVTVGLLLVGWGVVTQQVLASVFYACLAAFTDVGQPRYFIGYVQEYLLWRLRMPTHAFTWIQKVANVAAAAVVLLAILLVWRWLA